MQDANHQLFAESVLDEVLLSMAKPDEEAAHRLLAALDLDERAADHPLSLSGGQKQRTCIASALASEREVIVYDEPTSGLDLHRMRQVARLIHRRAASRGGAARDHPRSRVHHGLLFVGGAPRGRGYHGILSARRGRERVG